MSFLTPNQACMKLANELLVFPPAATDHDLHGEFNELISKIKAAGRSPSSPRDGVTTATQALAKYFGKVARREGSHGTSVSTILANTTRDVPFWRPLFGLTSKPGQEQNRSQTSGDVSLRLAYDSGPDCILEVARRIITRPWNEGASSLFRGALRLIANCCADNNLNRSVVIRRNGIELMMHLAKEKRECDLLLPTLYNVCIDYDEPAVDAHGRPWRAIHQLEADSDYQEDGLQISAADQKLGMCWDPSTDSSSVEILLDATEYAESCLSSLADLVEMASWVALYGIHNLVRQLDGSEPQEIVETSTIGLIDALLTKGSKLIRTEPECCTSICQAVMSVLSQKCTHSGMISIDGALWQLINLPYLFPLHDADQETIESMKPYKEAILQLVYEISSLEAYGNKCNAGTRLIRNCCEVLACGQKEWLPGSTMMNEIFEERPYASALVLLSNSIISTDRAEHLLEAHPSLVPSLTALIEHASDSQILRPAIDLAARLALCRKGQQQLRTSNIFRSVQKLLTPTTEANPRGIELQRETVELIRLVIKGKVEALPSLGEQSNGSEESEEQIGKEDRRRKNLMGSLTMTIFRLFDQTADAATKTGIGRLIIEILRTLASSSTTGLSSSTSQDKSGTGYANGAPSLTQDEEDKERILAKLESRLETIFPITNPSSKSSSRNTALDPAIPIAYIISQAQAQTPQTQSQSPSSGTGQEAEAWFGLGLLSSFPSYRGSILHALAANDHQLLTRLKQIVADNTNPASAVGDTTMSASALTASIASSLDVLSLNESSASVSVSRDSRPHNQQLQLQQQDARFANVKVLVVRMMQYQSQSSGRAEADSEGDDLKTARESLESIAADLGVDWILV